MVLAKKLIAIQLHNSGILSLILVNYLGVGVTLTRINYILALGEEMNFYPPQYIGVITCVGV